MRQTILEFDDRLHDAVRRRASEEGVPIPVLVRRLLGEALGALPEQPVGTLADFSFVGAGDSRQGDRAPVSERHDEALAEPDDDFEASGFELVTPH